MIGNKTEKQRIGEIGEELASRFLMKQGYRIIERNYRKPYGEIDIICEKAKRVVFVEVKTVSYETEKNVFRERNGVVSGGYYRPEDNIHPAKIARLSRAIETYLMRYKKEPEWQLDILSVYLNTSAKEVKIEHLEAISL